ncbi:FMN-dependent NADH-azoreductase [Sphingobium lignivorans]|uniref:FMN dependent NADH:quinone oxidoreductase n=1 Tax=Sphingobium lignivorans TaxID=2735886 RepID=A0ABR6NHD7_9SPHN|nr:NAD(P)H-dependent oxidoreductase [Sphingobium lignivorans]MBB5986700.1 FMN-dependent NADH-azoreductase [Sphingobium lignivorans]
MIKLLHIQSSPNLTNSVTRILSDEFVAQWRASHPETEVETLDLALDPIPHWGPDAIGGFMAKDGERTPEGQAAVDLSEKLIRQVEDAKILVIACPMYNMSMPTQLKSWVDHLTRAGRTFRFTGQGQYKGLIWNKKAFVILSRGGDYSQPPASASDFQEPLLRANLGLIGITDVTFIRAEGQRLQEAPSYIAKARETIAWVAG